MAVSSTYINPIQRIVTANHYKSSNTTSNNINFRAGEFKINNKTIKINRNDNLRKIVRTLNKARIPGVKRAEIKPNGIKIICTAGRVKISDNKDFVLLNLLKNKMIGNSDNQFIQFVKENKISGMNNHVRIKFNIPTDPQSHKVNLDNLFVKEAKELPKQQQFPYHLFLDIFNSDKINANNNEISDNDSEIATDESYIYDSPKDYTMMDAGDGDNDSVFGSPLKLNLGIDDVVDNKDKINNRPKQRRLSAPYIPLRHTDIIPPINNDSDADDVASVSSTNSSSDSSDGTASIVEECNDHIIVGMNATLKIELDELQQQRTVLENQLQHIREVSDNVEQELVNETIKSTELENEHFLYATDSKTMTEIFARLLNLSGDIQGITCGFATKKIDNKQIDIIYQVGEKLTAIIELIKQNNCEEKYDLGNHYNDFINLNNGQMNSNEKSITTIRQFSADFGNVVQHCENKVINSNSKLQQNAITIAELKKQMIKEQQLIANINVELDELNNSIIDKTSKIKVISNANF